ncbi:MAG: hypothetical protein R3D57_00885 [Hyphomicrobiaceae bacterium]
MTTLLIASFGVLVAYAIYIATMSARRTERPEYFLDGGRGIPAWGQIFAGTGIALAALTLHDHLLLVSAYGLQANHLAIGFVAVAIIAALFQKRLWGAARLTGLRTMGELIGSYYGSVSLRIFLLFLLFLFTVPVAAVCLSQLGVVINMTTKGEVPAGMAIWGVAFFLFLFSVIGGWRGVVYVIAARFLLALALLVFLSLYTGLTFDQPVPTAGEVRAISGVLLDRLPGVITFSAGFGKDTPVGGPWTTVAILSFALAMSGIALSPAFSLLGISTAGRRGLAFTHVWMIAGIGAGSLLLLGPMLAVEIGTGSTGGVAGLAAFGDRLASIDLMLGAAFVLLLSTGLEIAVAAFAMSGASAMTSELIGRYILPGLTGTRERTATRIALAFIYVAIAMAAGFAPLASAILAPLALSLAVQLIPALLGLCWLPWITRGGVISGLIISGIIVIFTEPAGIIAFERLFLDLPWGRWPLTVHSAAWGLFFNLIVMAIVSVATRKREISDERRRLHEAYLDSVPVRLGSPVHRTAKWSLTLVWLFFALGPGAILGNSVLIWPGEETGTLVQPVPSLLVWQVASWLTGIFLVWWLAYRSELSVIAVTPGLLASLAPLAGDRPQRIAPRWIGQGLGRLARRSDPEPRGSARR